MGRDARRALGLVCIMMLAPLAGCFGETGEDSRVGTGDVTITPETLIGGVFQGLTIAADRDLSAYIPYLILNTDTQFVQNSTVIDLKAGESVLLTVLAPPRTDTAVVLLGEYGRESWPVRSIDESWKTWWERGGFEAESGQGVSRITGMNNSIDTVNTTLSNGGAATPILLTIERPQAPGFAESEGGRHSTGLVDGRTVFNYINVMSDETLDPTDAADGAVGYLDRWAGQGNAAYEDAAQYLIQTMENFGLEARKS